MALDATALTTVARLRAWLTQGRTIEADGRLSDEALEELINRASATIASWCSRLLVAPAEPLTMTFDGDGGTRLVLPEWPLVSLDSLTVDGEPIPERVSPYQSGYVVRQREALVVLSGYRYAIGQQNVSVSARLGYDRVAAETDPRHAQALADLEQACLMLCAAWFDKPAAGSWQTLEEGIHATREAALLPLEVEGLLIAYRRLGV